MNISSKIRDVIKEEGVKITDLAKKMNTSQSNISTILSKDDMLISTLQRIADALNVPITRFFEVKLNQKEVEELIDKKIKEAFLEHNKQTESE